MARLCLRLPQIIQDPVPLLKTGMSASITLSQLQIACLLANAFFCTYPRRNSQKGEGEFSSYPSINFNTLFGGERGKCTAKRAAKFQCLFHYFDKVSQRGNDHEKEPFFGHCSNVIF